MVTQNETDLEMHMRIHDSLVSGNEEQAEAAFIELLQIEVNQRRKRVDLGFGNFIRISNEEFRTVEWKEVENNGTETSIQKLDR